MFQVNNSLLAAASLLVVGFLLLKLVAVVRHALFTDLKRIPGPALAPWTNLPLKLKVLAGQRSQYVNSLHEKYGNFVRISPTEVAVADLDASHAIHKVGSGFNKAEWYMKFTESPRPGIFAMLDPKQHAARRRLFAQAFSNTSITKYEPIVREKIDVAVSKIKRDAERGTADILKWFTFMATDVSGELSFGKSFGMLQVEEKTTYIRDLETTMMISGMRSELPFLIKIASYLPIKSIQHALGLRARLDAYGAQAIANHKAVVQSNPSAAESGLFSRFLDPKKNAELSDVEIAEEASNLIVAGSDTTAVSLTYLVWALLKPENSSALERVRAEIAPLELSASAAEIMALPYLKAAIDEALRLYGAAPGSLPRTVPPSGSVLGGYRLPGGVIVSTQAYTLHRLSSVFREPEKFDPSRWEHPTQEMKDAFMPFGAGARTCIGLHLAMMELFLGTFYFFKQCAGAKLAPSTTEDSMAFENYFLIAPKSHRCDIVLQSGEVKA